MMFHIRCVASILLLGLGIALSLTLFEWVFTNYHLFGDALVSFISRILLTGWVVFAIL